MRNVWITVAFVAYFASFFAILYGGGVVRITGISVSMAFASFGFLSLTRWIQNHYDAPARWQQEREMHAAFLRQALAKRGEDVPKRGDS